MTTAVLANHAHVFPASINPKGTIDRLLQLLDNCSIAHAVTFAPFAYQSKDESFEPNAWLAAELSKQKRLYGFGTIDFRRNDLVQQVRRAKELGFLGLKLHPNAQSFDITSPRAFEVYGAAEEHKLFCTFHSGVHRSKLADTRVLKFDELGWKFPKLKFSMEHVGGYHFFHEALAVLFNHVPPPWETGKSNVFAGLASVFTKDHNRFWHLTNDRLKELIAQIGVDQLIFGLDFPYNLEEQTRIAFDTIQNKLDLSPPDQAKILGLNLARELNLSLT